MARSGRQRHHPVVAFALTSPALPTIDAAPDSAAGLADEARRIHRDSVAYWSAYSTDEFFRRPSPEVWAPVDQVRHLTKSIRAVNKGLSLPWPVVLLRFGFGRRPSRTFDVLRADYSAVLSRGARAGAFAPAPIAPGEANEAGRARLMSYHATAVDAFANRLARWPRFALDRCRMPHPALGMLTVREMVYFTLLHNVHHVHVAERRRLESLGTRA